MSEAELLRELQEIREKVDRTRQTFVAPITTLAPEPYRLIRDIPIVVQPVDEGFTATFFDANIATSGDTEEEAISNLRTLIVDMIEYLRSEPEEALGPGPRRQLQVLNAFIEVSPGAQQR